MPSLPCLQYFHLDQVTVGPYGYQWDLSEGINHPTQPHLHIKIRHYESGEIDPSSLIYQLSTDTILTGRSASLYPVKSCIRKECKLSVRLNLGLATLVSFSLELVRAFD